MPNLWCVYLTDLSTFGKPREGYTSSKSRTVMGLEKVSVMVVVSSTNHHPIFCNNSAPRAYSAALASTSAPESRNSFATRVRNPSVPIAVIVFTRISISSCPLREDRPMVTLDPTWLQRFQWVHGTHTVHDNNRHHS